MPKLYEEAARLLLYLVAGGLVLNPLVEPCRIVTRLAEALEAACSGLLSDADAAAIILDVFDKHWLGGHDPSKRGRLIAVIGTFIANTPALRNLRQSEKLGGAGVGPRNPSASEKPKVRDWARWG